MTLCDGGSTYTKIYDTATKALSIIPTKDIVKQHKRHFDYATGHSSKHHCGKYVNELIALAMGGLSEINENNFTLLDIGSRDMKLVVFVDRQTKIMDWNSSCGGNMGFTAEVLGRYYDIDYDKLEPADKSIPVACGLLGIERIFDLINKGVDPALSVAHFIRGLAKLSYSFAKRPESIYLSGGFSKNKCFTKSLEKLCKVTTRGQDLLIKGLAAFANKEKSTENKEKVCPV